MGFNSGFKGLKVPCDTLPLTRKYSNRDLCLFM